ncbi:protein FAM71F2-like [Crotalus adamanteus]|uniref:Protein FAM71F2-like n=1 Tax=Crotalus adamanteus TaxID=8729 RepID=A0AAW1BF25_CROAD
MPVPLSPAAPHPMARDVGKTLGLEGGLLCQLIRSPDYNLFPNSAVFESNFIQVTKKGKWMNITHTPTIVTLAVTSSDPCLPLPNVLLMANHRAPLGRPNAGGPQLSRMDLTRLLPLRYVQLSVHSASQRILRLQTVTKTVYYLQLHHEHPEAVFALWSHLTNILHNGLSTTTKDPAIPIHHCLVSSRSSSASSISPVAEHSETVMRSPGIIMGMGGKVPGATSQFSPRLKQNLEKPRRVSFQAQQQSLDSSSGPSSDIKGERCPQDPRAGGAAAAGDATGAFFGWAAPTSRRAPAVAQDSRPGAPQSSGPGPPPPFSAPEADPRLCRALLCSARQFSSTTCRRRWCARGAGGGCPGPSRGSAAWTPGPPTRTRSWRPGWTGGCTASGSKRRPPGCSPSAGSAASPPPAGNRPGRGPGGGGRDPRTRCCRRRRPGRPRSAWQGQGAKRINKTTGWTRPRRDARWPRRMREGRTREQRRPGLDRGRGGPRRGGGAPGSWLCRRTWARPGWGGGASNTPPAFLLPAPQPVSPSSGNGIPTVEGSPRSGPGSHQGGMPPPLQAGAALGGEAGGEQFLVARWVASSSA